MRLLEKAKELLRKWLAHPEVDAEPDLKEELVSLESDHEILDRFGTDLEFGTGGLRGVIGAGTNRMNIFTVRKATMALAKYIKQFKDEPYKVVIAYDTRLNSKRFADEVAKVLTTQGIRVHFFDSPQPTPLLSFAVRHLQATMGVMITASHNPPQYNGYKVYDSDGSQILPPTAKRIQELMEDIDELEIQLDLDLDLLVPIDTGDLYSEYFKSIKHLRYSKPFVSLRTIENFKIVYSPLHGVGKNLTLYVLKQAGFQNIYLVDEQATPDPYFSNVTTPNPEDPSSFDKAIELAKEVKADIVITQDPDADRLGVAVPDQNGEYVILNGNQLGALLLKYLLTNRTLPKDPFIVKTIVTSDLGERIAKEHKVKIEEVLTGFKYIGRKITEYKNNGLGNFVFGFEESNGYLATDSVRDKDGIQAALLVCDMALYHKHHNRNLLDVLDKIYKKHGYYSGALLGFSFPGIEGRTKIENIMSYLRNQQVWQFFCDDPEKLVIEDYLTSTRHSGGRIQKLTLPQSNVLKFINKETGLWVAFRPSGTEPKLKVYIETCSKDLEEAEFYAKHYASVVTDLVKLAAEGSKNHDLRAG